MNNKEKIKAYLSRSRVCSYLEISEATGIQASMVSSLLRIMVRDGEIERVNHKSSSGRQIRNSYTVL
uniref:Transcriptional regulator n=1 Tax=Serratia phage Kevin TaxID=3161161 RepID=A0AAU8KY54_9CAUD